MLVMFLIFYVFAVLLSGIVGNELVALRLRRFAEAFGRCCGRGLCGNVILRLLRCRGRGRCPRRFRMVFFVVGLGGLMLLGCRG